MSDARQQKRLARLTRGSMKLASGRQHYLLIQNISRFGIGAKFSADRLSVGETVTITIPAVGQFTGTIRWQSAGRVGIQLDSAVNAEAIQFHNKDHIETKDSYSYRVAERFRPVATTWRPGFGKKK
ncbi:MAG: PilZ domain-containing protein [Sphingobium sp.]